MTARIFNLMHVLTVLTFLAMKNAAQNSCLRYDELCGDEKKFFPDVMASREMILLYLFIRNKAVISLLVVLKFC